MKPIDTKKFITKYFSYFFTTLIILYFLPFQNFLGPFQSFINFELPYITLSYILSVLVAMFILSHFYDLKQLHTIKASASIVGILSFITLLPISVLFFLHFDIEKLIKFGYVVLFLLANGAIIYLFIKK